MYNYFLILDFLKSLTGGLEMIQTWVALPEKDEEADLSFVNYTSEQLVVFTEKGMLVFSNGGDPRILAKKKQH
jgi:redox-sensitive bicupin YhaK (pirin superfamily)